MKPTLWIDGKPVDYEIVRTPIYPRSRLKRLWWRIWGIQPTRFDQSFVLKQAPSTGKHVAMWENTL